MKISLKEDQASFTVFERKQFSQFAFAKTYLKILPYYTILETLS